MGSHSVKNLVLLSVIKCGNLKLKISAKCSKGLENKNKIVQKSPEPIFLLKYNIESMKQ